MDLSGVYHDNCVRLLSQTGERIDCADYPLTLDDEALLELHSKMSIIRALDEEAVRLQRQGVLNLWPPVFGQEAAQVGSAAALAQDDFAFPQGREWGVAITRGIAPEDLIEVWNGQVQGGSWNVAKTNTALYTFPIGSQAPHAVGYAMGMVRDGVKALTICYIGDGAFGTGDLHEAMVWAGVFHLPVVFFCQNNQYAISVPVSRQSARPLFARAEGFGVRGIQIDGNDVLACYEVCSAEFQRVKDGGGPVLIEAVTYRMGPHTTSDDPTRYRSKAEEQAWTLRDPITRLESLFTKIGLLTPDYEEAIAERKKEAARRLREFCLKPRDAHPENALFDNVYSTPPEHLVAERAAWEEFRTQSVEVAEHST